MYTNNTDPTQKEYNLDERQSSSDKQHNFIGSISEQSVSAMQVECHSFKSPNSIAKPTDNSASMDTDMEQIENQAIAQRQAEMNVASDYERTEERPNRTLDYTKITVDSSQEVMISSMAVTTHSVLRYENVQSTPTVQQVMVEQAIESTELHNEGSSHFHELDSIIQRESLFEQNSTATQRRPRNVRSQKKAKETEKNPMMDRIKNALKQPHLADINRPKPSLGDIARNTPRRSTKMLRQLSDNLIGGESKKKSQGRSNLFGAAVGYSPTAAVQPRRSHVPPLPLASSSTKKRLSMLSPKKLTARAKDSQHAAWNKIYSTKKLSGLSHRSNGSNQENIDSRINTARVSGAKKKQSGGSFDCRPQVMPFSPQQNHSFQGLASLKKKSLQKSTSPAVQKLALTKTKLPVPAGFKSKLRSPTQVAQSTKSSTTPRIVVQSSQTGQEAQPARAGSGLSRPTQNKFAGANTPAMAPAQQPGASGSQSARNLGLLSSLVESATGTHHHKPSFMVDTPVYESTYDHDKIQRSKSQTADEQLESHKLYLRRVREANTCSCKYLIRQLHDQVSLCQEMLEAMCKPRTNVVIGKFYLRSLLEDVRFKHANRQAEQLQQQQQEAAAITLEELSTQVLRLQNLIQDQVPRTLAKVSKKAIGTTPRGIRGGGRTGGGSTAQNARVSLFNGEETQQSFSLRVDDEEMSDEGARKAWMLDNHLSKINQAIDDNASSKNSSFMTNEVASAMKMKMHAMNEFVRAGSTMTMEESHAIDRALDDYKYSREAMRELAIKLAPIIAADRSELPFDKQIPQIMLTASPEQQPQALTSLMALLECLTADERLLHNKISALSQCLNSI